MTIVHLTPGLLDIRSITTVGLSAKPTTENPIGFFGTGLKYSIATLMRMGASVTLWIGLDRYEFSTTKDTFRGTGFDRLRVRQQRHGLLKARWLDLPYTTEYGKLWQPWMVLRELHSNTLDEGGETVRQGVSHTPLPNVTAFVIDHPEYEEAYDHIDDVFLPDGLRVSPSRVTVQALPGESKSLYYRSLKVHALDKPSVMTWNILSEARLTEDRTLASIYTTQFVIATHVVMSDDEELIEAVVTADKDHWEHDIEFPSWVSPSAAFKRFMARNPKYSNPYLGAYWGRYDDRPAPSPIDVWKSHPQPWCVTDNHIMDANHVTMFERPVDHKGRWKLFAEELVVRAHRTWEPPQPEPEESPASEPEETTLEEAKEGVSF